MPVLFVESHTFDTVQSVNELYGRIEPTDSKRIATALGWFGKYVNVSELTRRVVSQRSTKVTPRMFEYSLLEKAAENRQRIVLPEGTGERILNATDIILRRGVADITLLGREEEIRAKASSWASTSTARPSSTRPSRSTTTSSCRWPNCCVTCAPTRA